MGITASDVMTSLVRDHLYRWVEQNLGIRAADDALAKLDEYLTAKAGVSYTADPARYEQVLTSSGEMKDVSRIITVNETYFFREEASFGLLRDEILPRFARAGRPIRVCSAASSIGCEAYSIAMLMDDFSRGTAALGFEIDVFDVSTQVVEAAEAGRYTANSFREDGGRWKPLIDRYVRRDKQDYVVDESLKKNMRFFCRNIMDGFFRTYDIIFFRNALIYFSPEGRKRLLDILANALNCGGVLLLGASETPAVSHPALENSFACETFYFRKKDDRPQGRRASDNGGDAAEWDGPERRIGERRTGERRSGLDRRQIDRRIALSFLPERETESRAEGGERRCGTGDRRGTGREAREAEAAAGGRERRAEPVSVVKPRTAGQTVDAEAVAAAAGADGGEGIAAKVLQSLKGGEAAGADELCAAAMYLLGAEDFEAADRVITALEGRGESAFSSFLRGEYYFHRNVEDRAEECYRDASVRDAAFWPAFFRLSSLAAGGDKKRYRYKTEKALESIDAARPGARYENFIGGFSPDYYRQALTRRLGMS